MTLTNVHLAFFLCFLEIVLLFLSVESRNETSENLVPCAEGWYFFGGKCYRTFGALSGKQNRQSASKYCESLGGHLATIQSKEVQEFLLNFLFLEADSPIWIGLNYQGTAANLEWDDGTGYNYSNWDSRPVKGYCVSVRLFNYYKGKWVSEDCFNIRSYICQVDEGQQHASSPNPTLCPSALGGGWKFGDSCYNLIKEEMTWEDAEKHCQDEYNGHLVTVLDFNVNYFLQYILSNYSSDIWIGIKVKGKLQQVFSSGLNVGYTSWNERTPQFADGTCVIRTVEKTWRVVFCKKKYSFICEVSAVSLPALKKPPEGFTCPGRQEDWLDPGGEFCYFLDESKSIKWHSAFYECSSKGSSLASFHSKSDVYSLIPYVNYADSPRRFHKWVVFIGHYRGQTIESEFSWVDGSQMDYTNWDPNEPLMNKEKCGCMHLKLKTWYVCDCYGTFGYLCSVKKILPNTTETNESPVYEVSLNITEIKEKPVCEVTPNSTKTEENPVCKGAATFRILFGVFVSLLLVAILLSVVIYFHRSRKRARRGGSTVPMQTLES